MPDSGAVIRIRSDDPELDARSLRTALEASSLDRSAPDIRIEGSEVLAYLSEADLGRIDLEEAENILHSEGVDLTVDWGGSDV